MTEERGRLRVVMSQYERDRLHAARLDVEQPPGLHVKAGGNKAMR
jgi:hypothetical protein